MPFWAFSAFFIAGGLMALYLSVSQAPDLLTAALGSVIGLGNIAGGTWMLRREPASVVEVDPSTNQVRVVRWGLIGRRERIHALDTLAGVDIEVTEHSDGGNVYRPRLSFGTAEHVPVSLFWYQTEAAGRAVVDELKEFLAGAPGHRPRPSG